MLCPVALTKTQIDIEDIIWPRGETKFPFDPGMLIFKTLFKTYLVSVTDTCKHYVRDDIFDQQMLLIYITKILEFLHRVD